MAAYISRHKRIENMIRARAEVWWPGRPTLQKVVVRELMSDVLAVWPRFTIRTPEERRAYLKAYMRAYMRNYRLQQRTVRAITPPNMRTRL